MSGKKILPINLNPIINSECGVFYRTSIIECLPYGMEWITTHITMMTKGDGEITIGVDERPFMVEHYSEILDTDYIDYENVSVGEVTDCVKELINQNKYSYVMMNADIMYRGEFNNKNPYVHDYIVYGYDDVQQVFHVAALSRRGISDILMPYDNFRKSYSYIIKMLHDNPDKQFEAFFAQFYIITCVCPRKYIVKDKKYIYDAMRVIKYYLIAKRHTVNEFNKDGTLKKAYVQYYGLGIVIGMSDLVDKYFSDHIVWRGIRCIDKSAKRISEMHIIMLNLLSLLANKLNLHTEIYNNMFSQYKSITDNAEKCHLLSMKFVTNSDEKVLRRLKDLYSKMYTEESVLLSNIYDYVYKELVKK